MHQLDIIDGASTALRRIDALLGMVLQIGPDAQIGQVMEVNSLVKDEVARVLLILEEEVSISACVDIGPGPSAVSPSAPAQGGAAVVTLRPSQRG
jgi:hypothetical protein